MKTLNNLEPLEFEHLVYDLLILKGMTNLVWRTPGRDGGRDLEGYFYHHDISGFLVEQHWYIECKKYSTAVDWPTVFGKLAFAKNASADYLLMVTSKSFSPQCLDEIKKWNASSEKTKIRFWGLHDLEWELNTYNQLRVKYRFTDDPREQAMSLLQIANISSKYTQSAYNMFIFSPESNQYIEAAAALSEFLLCLISKLGERRKDPFKGIDDTYEWLKLDKIDSYLDRFFFRALVSCYRVATKSKIVYVESPERSKLLITGDGLRKFTSSQVGDFNLLGLWANCEINVSNNALNLIIREPANGC